MSGYVSPFQVRKTRSSPPVRRHVFPQAPDEHGAREQLCLPRACREHWREKHWTEGQTHG